MRWVAPILILWLACCADLWADSEILRPKDDGVKAEWTAYPGIPPIEDWEGIDEEVLDTDDGVASSTIDQIGTFSTLYLCPDDWKYIRWADSVRLVIVAYGSDGTGGNNRIEIGRSKAEEAQFSWCGETDTVDLGDNEWNTFTVSYSADPCVSGDWAAYNVNDFQWSYRHIEIMTGGAPAKKNKIAQAYVEIFCTMPAGSDSVLTLSPDSSCFSEWTKSGCTTVDECLSVMACDDIRINVDGELEIWGIDYHSSTYGIDSVEVMIEGYAQPGGDSLVEIYYGVDVEENGTWSKYGLDTVDIGTIATGLEYYKVWTQNPYTSSTWTWADLNNGYRGFGVGKIGTNYNAIRCSRSFVYCSEPAAGDKAKERRMRLLHGGDR